MAPETAVTNLDETKVLVSNGPLMPVPVKLEPDPTVYVGNFKDLLDLRQTYPIIQNRQAFEYKFFRTFDELATAAGLFPTTDAQAVLNWLGEQGYETSYEILVQVIQSAPNRAQFGTPLVFRRIA